ncbi:hypothetical protein ABIC32_001414 [Brevundimonas sp. 1080]
MREDIKAGRLVRVLEDWTPDLSPLSLCYPVAGTRRRRSRLSSTLRDDMERPAQARGELEAEVRQEHTSVRASNATFRRGISLMLCSGKLPDVQRFTPLRDMRAKMVCKRCGNRRPQIVIRRHHGSGGQLTELWQ